MAEKCELLVKTKALAIKKGLDPEQVRCPIRPEDCSGTFCIYLSPLGDTGPQQLEKFQTRQEKTEELQLQRLRQELAETGGQQGGEE